MPPPTWSQTSSAASAPASGASPSTPQHQKHAKGGPNVKGKGSGKPTGKNAEVCRGFNNGNCKMGDKCRYRHVCSGCGGKHP
eukprot:551604-Amphidinium_carterae.1